ncbi:MAG: hypothetical protein MJ237_04500 [bacterium]|nr:hypothetical protein [bacterium]
MSINIMQTMNNYQFENRENLRNTARDILSGKKHSSEDIQKIIDRTFSLTDDSKYINAQKSIIMASSQITLNKSLKATLNYLKSQSNNKKKQHILGELWNTMELPADTIIPDDLGEIIIDFSKNIFIAA